MPKTIQEITTLIQQDMENDMKEIDGLPFDGKTMGTYFGRQAAAIIALAMLVSQLDNQQNKEGES